MFATVTITRRAAGSYVDGRWAGGASSSLSIVASVQPDRPRPDELLHLPEGDRAREGLRLYTATEVRTANETNNTPADMVTWAGEQWEVVKVEKWPASIAHYKALCLRVSRP